MRVLNRTGLLALGMVASLSSGGIGAVKTFQQGAALSDGRLYWGTQDTELQQASPSSNLSASTSIGTDTEATTGNTATQIQSLLKFNNLFGPLPSQIPFGSTINSVNLTLRTGASTNNQSDTSTHLNRMLTPWHELTTWNTVRSGGGVLTNNSSASSTADATFIPASLDTDVVISTGLVNTVQSWSNGQSNQGWALLPNGSNGWKFNSSEFSTQSLRPKLTIDYTPAPAPKLPTPKNVILMVGDGMGLEAINAARMALKGNNSPLNFETFAHTALMTHDNVSQSTTDSAASSTAMATGVKVANGTISQESGVDLTTVLEILKARGKSTGLVTSGTEITDATPSGFGAHESSRNNTAAIANDMLTQTRPNVLFGRPGGMTVAAAQAAGYTVVTSETELAALNTNSPLVSGQFAGVSSTVGPSLATMTSKALDLLDNNSSGFFLLVETEDTDEGAHANNLSQVLSGVDALTGAVQSVLNFTAGRNDTLVILLADHETGGLSVTNGGLLDTAPIVTWGLTGHTSTPVGVFAFGPGSELINGTIDNTDIFAALTVPEPGTISLLTIAGVALLTQRRRR